MTSAAKYAAACLAATISATTAAQAQQSNGSDLNGTILETITVTAQKRAQNIQDVGTAITAFDNNAIRKLGLSDTTAIAAQVPGLQFNQYSPTVTIFNIRGVSQNDFSDHQESPVAVYIDGSYIANTGAVAGSMYDMERVEVLRGPQGTLFGRNATGGLIHFITKKPTDTLEGYAKATVGRFGQVSTEGAVGGPLGDKVDARLSFATDDHGGYIHNLIGPDVGNQHQYAGRLQLLFKLPDQGELLLKVHGVRNKNEVSGPYSWAAAVPTANGLGRFELPNEDYWGTCAGCDMLGYKNPSTSPWTGNYDRRGLFDRKYWGASADLKWNFSWATLRVISDYQKIKKLYGEDSDVSPNALFNYDTSQNFNQFSQEIHLSGDSEKLHWVAGLYYLHLDSKDTEQVTLPAFEYQTFVPFETKTNSYAVFGQAEYKIADEWSVIGGLRYTSDNKKQYYSLYENGDNTLNFNPTLYPDLADQNYRNISGKFEINYKPEQGVLIYASVNRGTKGGGFSAPSLPPVLVPQLPFGQETLMNYEGGFKTTLFGGSTRLNGGLFYYDYKNYQAFSIINLTQIISNNHAHVKGGELELSTIPARGWQVNVGISALDTNVKAVNLPDGELVDRAMPQAPNFSANLLVRYEWPLFRGMMSAQTDWKYDSAQWFMILNNPDDHEKARMYGNVRLAYTTGDGHWDLAAFVKNVTNKEYRVYNLDISSLGIDQQVFAPPRWWGASIAYHFGD